LAVASAHAGVIFDNVDFSGEQTVTIPITAMAGTLELGFHGYNLPAYDYVEDISLTTGGGSNLLGETWQFVPAASGSYATQFPDTYGTGTNALSFGGATVGVFDNFYQRISTIAGQTYNLTFTLFGNGTIDQEVTASAGVPEPSTWALALVGLGGFGAALRSRRRAALAA
jgi:PEP-CTERM motif